MSLPREKFAVNVKESLHTLTIGKKGKSVTIPVKKLPMVCFRISKKKSLTQTYCVEGKHYYAFDTVVVSLHLRGLKEIQLTSFKYTVDDHYDMIRAEKKAQLVIDYLVKDIYDFLVKKEEIKI